MAIKYNGKDINNQQDFDKAMSESASEATKKERAKNYQGGTRETSRGGKSGLALDADFFPAISMLKDLPVVGTAFEKLADTLNKTKALLDPVETMFNVYDAFVMEDQRKFFFEMKDQFGDFNRLQDESANQTVENFRQSRQNINEVYTASVEELEKTKPEMLIDVRMPDGTFQKMNMLTAAYDDLDTAQKDYYAELYKLDETYTTQLSKDLVGKEEEILRFTKGFNFSSEQTMTFVKRQLDMTGKAGTDMLEDLQTYSMAVSDATGVSFKTIAKTTERVISDVERFGTTTTEQATKIAGALNKAGISFQSFSSMVGKFQSFDQAASSVADLTAVFGIHLDAMDLMVKSYEDPAAMMYDLRDAFLDTGKSVEDLTLPELQMFAREFGMEIPEVQKFLREGFLPDEDALEEATSTANAEEAIDRLNDGIVTLMDRGASVAEVTGKAVKEALTIPLQDMAIDLTREIAGYGAFFQDELKDLNVAIEQAIGTQKKLETMEAQIRKTSPQDMVETTRKLLDDETDGYFSGMKKGIDLGTIAFIDHLEATNKITTEQAEQAKSALQTYLDLNDKTITEQQRNNARTEVEDILDLASGGFDMKSAYEQVTKKIDELITALKKKNLSVTVNNTAGPPTQSTPSDKNVTFDATAAAE